MKKFIKNLLAVALVGAMLGSFGCKDYDEDIKSLNDRVDKVEASVADLQAKIDAGAVITGVTNNGDGVVVTLSDGQSFTLKHGTNGQPGQPGKDGKDADVWTIGDDGFWYKNGTKTEYKALGIKGDKGDKGDDGKYYFPGEDGLWDIYENGQKVEDTNISWAGQGLTAVYSNGTVTLSGVEGAEGTVTIKSGAQLGSVAFVPNKVSSAIHYPTTDEPWKYIENHIDEAKYDALTLEFIPQAWNKSNTLDLVYRLNPSDAYVGGAQYAYLNRDITTRAAGDQADLLSVESTLVANGEATVTTSYNHTGYNTAAGTYNFAALQVWAGQNPVTSDYLVVTNEEIDGILVNTTDKSAFYNRTKTIEKGESDEFVKSFVGVVNTEIDGVAVNADKDFIPTTPVKSESFVTINGVVAPLASHFDYNYNDENPLDLAKKVGLYSVAKGKYLNELGFTGISYEFSKPADYRANDDTWTNQQDFINVTADGKVTINKNGKWVNENGSLAPAEGRTPVVRVDAYMMSNKDAKGVASKKLYASAYIKLNITEKAPAQQPTPELPDMPNNDVLIGDVEKAYDYRALDAEYDVVGEMGWERVNNELYGKVSTNAVEFWSMYGGANDVYDVVVKVNGTAVTGGTFTDLATNKTNTLTVDGIQVTVNLNKSNTTSSYVKVAINNLVKTQHTYADGANYEVVLTVKSENIKEQGNFVLTQKFAVADSCPDYKYNPAYDHNYEGVAANASEAAKAACEATGIADAIVVKGDIDKTSGRWVIKATASETFFVTTTDKNIFEYYKTDDVVTNVEDITFAWVAADKVNWAGSAAPAIGNDEYVEPAAAITNTDFDYKVVKEMVAPFIVKSMNLTQTLVNGEECGQTYNVVFLNPFTGVCLATEPVKIFGNTAGDQVAETADKVAVQDIYHQNKQIATYDIAARAFKVVENTYGVTADQISFVSFDWDKGFEEFDNNDQYADTKLQLGDGVDLPLGQIVWNNMGHKLDESYTMNVIATVKVEGVSTFKVEIPFLLAAEEK